MAYERVHYTGVSHVRINQTSNVFHLTYMISDMSDIHAVFEYPLHHISRYILMSAFYVKLIYVHIEHCLHCSCFL